MKKVKVTLWAGLSLAVAIILAPILGGVAMAESKPAPAVSFVPLTLTPDQQEEIKRVEDYINQLTTVKAKFQQYSSSNGPSTGDLYLRRPGRLRVEYDPPSSILLVADGLALSYMDRELNNLEQAPLGASPLWFLLKKKVDLTEDVAVTSFRKEAGVLSIGLIQKDDPDAGEVTLVFGEKPLELRQWTLRDAGGGEVQVALYNTEFGLPLANKLFATPRKAETRLK